MIDYLLRRMNAFLGGMVISFILLSTYSMAQDFRNNLDEIIKSSLEEITSVPGLSIVVAHSDSIYFMGSYGYADVGEKKSATISTPYYIASVTKSFTGLLAQILESEGLINLDTSIIAYRPFRDIEENDIFRNITIRNLLTHTSGISNGYLVWRNALSGQYTDELMVMLLEKYTSSLGSSQFKYDNLGYNIFDIILREEFNSDWRVLLSEKIFVTLGMSWTTAFMSISEEKQWGNALPYVGLGQNCTPLSVDLIKTDKVMQAAGGLISSISDIGKWLLFNINQGTMNGQKIYANKIVENSLKASTLFDKKGSLFSEKGYGLGWYTAHYKNEVIHYHNGGFAGYAARVSFMPEKKIGVAVLVNENFFGDNVADLLTPVIYDNFLENNLDTISYFKKLRELKEKTIDFSNSYASIKKSRAATALKLSQRLDSYVGAYENEGYGRFLVLKQNKGLTFKMGILHANGIPTESDETLMVELSGIGSKSNIKFIIEENKVKKLIYKGLEFDKLDRKLVKQIQK